jgi:hypothetical protein
MIRGSIAQKGFIIGGIVILASALGGPGTMLPWYIKVIGGVGLIIYGVFRIFQGRDKGV